MSLRDLLCILEATEAPSNVALAQALALARGYRAHCAIVVSAPEPVVPRTFLHAALIDSAIQQEIKKIHARGEALAETVREACAAAGVLPDIDTLFEPFAELLERAVGWARCHDLVVIERPEGVLERRESLFEEVLFTGGGPLLIATPNCAPVETVNSIALAWDGSAHAARALALALGLFPTIKQADVVAVSGEKNLSDTVAGAEVAPRLDRHGIKTNVADLPMEKGGVAATIDQFAAKSGADLIVMGGFGHSRLREFVLGGVTRALSRTARTPLLLAH